MARTKTTPNPPPPINYKALYHWALDSLLAENSQINTFKDINEYKKSEYDEKFHVFGREHDLYVKVLPCKEGEPVCVDDRASPEEPLFFMYAITFKRLKLRLPFTGFERALLTEVNVALAQLHPNSWAFVWAFAVLCNHFGHTPSMDVFLYFFEAKSPGKKLWMSFNGVVGRVLLTLFQQSYKGFKGKFFKICCNKHDRTLLDGFPLYWVEKAGLKKPRSLEDLASPNREVCQFLSSLRVVFNTAELIKLEYSHKPFKAYIDTLSDFVLYCFLPYYVGLCSYALLFSCVDMVLNVEKMRKLAELVSQRKATLADAYAFTLAGTLPVATSAPNSFEPPHRLEAERGGGGYCLRKVELFNHIEEELTNDATNAYGVGFENVIA